MDFQQYQTLTINGQTLNGKEITSFCQKSEQENIRKVGIFIADWISESPTLKVRTSGSTGSPKFITVEKRQMLQSAAMTASCFGFREGQTALLCLPMNYIAGKMMVVRALFSKLNLYCIPPQSHPLDELPEEVKIHFAPLVPMQLQQVTHTKGIQKILLGGAPVSPAEEEQFSALSAEIFHGYGMTETLSHVALRRVNGPAAGITYHALEGITFAMNEQGCLRIQAPFLPQSVQTNDVVELLDKQRFIWKGRADNVINSGGIKLFPEEIEKRLFPVIPGRFFVAGLPDRHLGEKLVLFIEGTQYSAAQSADLKRNISRKLDPYEKPRELIFIKQFPLTESGKIKRKALISAFRH